MDIEKAFEIEASSYFKKKKGKDEKAFGISKKKSNVRHGGSGYRDEEIDENKIVVGGKELDREWTGWWWRKNEKWTVVDGKNNMLASAKSRGEAEKWMKKLKDASQTTGDFSLAIGNPKLMLNHGQFGMPGLDFDKIFKSVNKDPDQLTIRKIDKKDHDRYFERAKKVNKKYDYTNLELTYDGGRKHYAPKKVKEEIGEAVNLKQLRKQYDKNEDENKHTENYLLLAKAFGSKSEVKKVQDIMKRNEKQGHTSKSDMDWMYKNINPYYDKIRNEEYMKLEDTVKDVLVGKKEEPTVEEQKVTKEDSDKDEPGTQGDMAAYQKKRKAVAKKFGVSSCSQLDGAKKKACYSALDKAHVADHEEQVELEKMRKEETQKTFSKMFTHIKTLKQGK